jgi:hypothetical protein
MERSKVFALSMMVAGLTALNAFAQQELQFSFRGTWSQTNTAGKIVTTAITETNLLQDIADRAGVDVKTLGIAYHVNGTAFGDTVDVINPSNGGVMDNVFGLYFSDAFGRTALVTKNGEKSLPYIYTGQNTHSLGSALLTKSLVVAKGQTNTMYQATIRYEITPTGNQGTRVIVGKFTASKPLVFAN